MSTLGRDNGEIIRDELGDGGRKKMRR